MIKQQKELPKASELFKVDFLMKNGIYTGWYLTPLENNKGIFKTEKEARNLIDLWNRAPELEKENEMFKEIIKALLGLKK